MAALRAKTDRHGGVPWLEPELGAVFAALDAVSTPDLPEYVDALEKVAAVARKVSFQGEPGDLHRLWEAVTALDAAPAGTGEQLAARLTDRMRARDTTEHSMRCAIAAGAVAEPWRTEILEALGEP